MPSSVQESGLGITPSPMPESQAPNTGVTTFSSARKLSQHLHQSAMRVERGFRTLLVSDAKADEIATKMLELSRSLAQSTESILLIDWNLTGNGISKELDIKLQPGVAELLDKQSVTFTDVVNNLNGSRAHIIPSGNAHTLDPNNLNGEQLNLVLDALDEAYDQIIIVSNRRDATLLFEAIGGRVDAGIMYSGISKKEGIPKMRPDQFLGYDVMDIEILNWQADSAGEAPRRGRVLAPTRVR